MPVAKMQLRSVDLFTARNKRADRHRECVGFFYVLELSGPRVLQLNTLEGGQLLYKVQGLKLLLYIHHVSLSLTLMCLNRITLYYREEHLILPRFGMLTVCVSVDADRVQLRLGGIGRGVRSGVQCGERLEHAEEAVGGRELQVLFWNVAHVSCFIASLGNIYNHVKTRHIDCTIKDVIKLFGFVCGP